MEGPLTDVFSGYTLTYTSWKQTIPVFKLMPLCDLILSFPLNDTLDITLLLHFILSIFVVLLSSLLLT